MLLAPLTVTNLGIVIAITNIKKCIGILGRLFIMIIELAKHREVETNKNFEKALNRLTKLVKDKYFCNSRYVEFSNTVKADKLSQLVKILISTKQSVTISETTYFPVYRNDKVISSFVVEPSIHLAKSDIDDIEALISVTIQPFINLKEQKSFLNEREKNFFVNLSNPQNIVPFSQKNHSSNLYKIFNPLFLQNKVKLNVPTITFIQSINQLDGYKMALEIHEKSASMAFLRYDEQNHASRKELLTNEDIGELTIYIPELKKLSASEQEHIYNFQDKYRDTKAHFVFTTTHPIKHLVELGIGYMPLLENYRSSFIYMDKPFDYYKRNNYLYLFFLNSLKNKM
jgi:hypothetical protein